VRFVIKRSWNLCAIALTCSLTLVSQSQALSRFVSLTGSATPPYTNLTMAARDIQTALNAAQADDTVWVAAGTYLLTNEIVITKRLHLRALFPRYAILDAQYKSRVISVNSTNSTISGLVVKNGFDSPAGGGLLVPYANTISNCVVVSNTAFSGGGIYIEGASKVVNCIIEHNESLFDGGGVVFLSDPGGLIAHCFIQRNVTHLGSAGGVSMQGAGTIAQCWVADNTGGDVGGMRLTDCSVINTVISENQGNYVGGLETYGGVSMVGCTLVSNTSMDALGVGGMNGHFSTGGGIYKHSLTVRNSIVYFNTANGNTRNYAYGSMMVDHCCTTPPLGTDCITNPPTFADLGGRDYHLVPGSSCVDAGWDTYGVETDYDGQSRPKIGKPGSILPRPDVGAYELVLRRPANDFNHSARSDFVVFNPPNGSWYAKEPGGAVLAWSNQWGWSSALTVPGDYNGDANYDLAVYDPKTGKWFIKTLSGATLLWDRAWGGVNGKPVPGDYDGDNRWDMAVFDPKGGFWNILTVSGTTLANANQWGWSTAKPVPGDYNGDGTWDQAVFDTQGGSWYIKTLSGSTLAWAYQWGWSTAKPVPGDYNGDGRFDQAVFDSQGGYWYIKTLSGTVLAWQVQWGWSSAIPVSGDFNGDGKYDLAVYDSATGLWYVRNLSGGVIAWGVNWGWPGATVPRLGD
jgi:hypothetical protein